MIVDAHTGRGGFVPRGRGRGGFGGRSGYNDYNQVRLLAWMHAIYWIMSFEA